LYFLGIDFGTTGARACVTDAGGAVVHEDHRDFGSLEDYERAGLWREALWDLVAALPPAIRLGLSDIAVDGTSGTMLACDEELSPRHPPLLYDDDRAVDEAALIAKTATAGHPAAAVTSGLAKVLWLKKRLGLTGARLYLSQADWLAGLLSGRVGMTDYHNALKLGLDLDTLRWPAWVEYLADVDYLPVPIAPGARLGTVSRPRARYLGVNPGCMVHGRHHRFHRRLPRRRGERQRRGRHLARQHAGAEALSDIRVESVEHGSIRTGSAAAGWRVAHPIGGGAVLRQFFDDRQLAALSEHIKSRRCQPARLPPLPRTGERFPVNDPDLAPCSTRARRTTPRFCMACSKAWRASRRAAMRCWRSWGPARLSASKPRAAVHRTPRGP
jgi:Sugar (pentulose and hexulose) kinases